MWVSSDPDSQNTVMILFLALAQVLQQGAFIVYGGGSLAVPGISFGNILAPGDVLHIVPDPDLNRHFFYSAYAGLFLFLRDTKIGKAIRSFLLRTGNWLKRWGFSKHDSTDVVWAGVSLSSRIERISPDPQSTA